MPLIAALQMVSGPHVEANLLEAERLIAKAADAGAKLVVLPENFALMGRREADKVAARETPGDGPLQHFLAAQAVRRQLWLVGGTIPLAASDDRRVRASCLLYDDQGRLAARYDKIHLFDVQIVDSGERYAESATIEPGGQPVVADTPFGRLGLAVCYDLRFPELYRSYALSGVNLFLISAEWPVRRIDHWNTLLRARAIENQSFMVAVNTVGKSGAATYGGSSAVISPWGETLLQAPSDTEAVLSCEIDFSQLAIVRAHMPVFSDRRPDLYK